MPKVSVIIPVYNVEKYLCQCLDSLINQTLKDIEIICVDDGSTDNSLEILKEYMAKDDRFIVLHQENQGAGAARNKGLEFAKGEYLHFMDGDDYIENNFYEEMYQTVKVEQADLVYCSWNIIQEKGARNSYPQCKIKCFSKKSIDNVDRLSVNCEVWNKLFEKSLIYKYNIRFPLFRYGEDTSFTNQYLIVANNICGIPKNLYNYRVTKSGLMASLICDGSKCTDSNNSQCYTLNYINELQKSEFQYGIEYFVTRLRHHVYFIFSMCPINMYEDLLDDINALILNKIPMIYIKDNLLKQIKNKKYDKAIARVTKNAICKDTMFKKYLDIRCVKIFNHLFSYKKENKFIQDINVTFLTDDKYFHCTYIAITSLIDSKNPETFITINIFICNLSNLQRRLLENFNNIDIKINIVDIDISKYNCFKNVHHVTPTSLAKFDFAEILKDTGKTLYIDGDVIINKDLSELYNIDINKFYLAATREYRAEMWKYQQLLGTKYYINSGVMLLNLKKMREDNLSNRFFEIKKTQPSSWLCQDQDVINYVCADKIMYLPPIYNYTVGIIIQENYSIDEINNFYDTNYKNFQDLYNKSLIVHYAGNLKPWNSSNLPKDMKKKYRYINNHILINSNYSQYSFVEKLFSVKNKNIHKVVTVFGLKFKIKSKKLIQKQRIDNIEKDFKKYKDAVSQKILMQNEVIKDLQIELKNLKNSKLSTVQAANITELAMLKTKYHWNDIKIPVIKNTSETIRELINSNKSIIRFGDGEFNIMEGNSICFQNYNPIIAEKLKEIFRDNNENILIGVPEIYYDYSIDLSEKSKSFILGWFSKWHKIIEKYYNYDRVYYSAHISQMYPVYARYDFESHYKDFKQIWDNKKITVVTGDRVYNNIEYDVFENASEVSYIYGPTENAFDSYDILKEQVSNVKNDNILIFALEPAGKILAYDMYKLGYRVLDLGHLIKDYDFYKKSSSVNDFERNNMREAFFMAD